MPPEHNSPQAAPAFPKSWGRNCDRFRHAHWEDRASAPNENEVVRLLAGDAVDLMINYALADDLVVLDSIAWPIANLARLCRWELPDYSHTWVRS